MKLPSDLCGNYVDVNLDSFVKRSEHPGIFEQKLQMKIF